MRDVFIEHKTILTGLYYQHPNGPEYTFELLTSVLKPLTGVPTTDRILPP